MTTTLPRPAAPRPLQGIERLWLAADHVERQFVIHAVVEGTLTRPEGWLDRVREAVASAAEAHPGLRLRLTGYGPWLAWRSDGDGPAVAEVDGEGWTGDSPDGAPWLDRRLDLRRGPAVEVLLVRGNPERVVIRIHHAQADGRAIQGYLRSIFAALRGEALPPAALAPRDVDLLDGLLGAGKLPDWKAPERDQTALTGPVTDLAGRSTWAHVHVDGVSPRAVFPRVLLAFREERAHEPGVAPRVSVPVDLRPPGASWDGNVTGIASIPPAALADAHSIRAALEIARSPRTCGSLLALADRLRPLPVWLIGWSGRGSARAQLRQGRFDTPLTVSNLGREALGALSGGGFEAVRVWWIPPPTPGNPLFVLLSGHENGVDLCASAPVGLAGDHRLSTLLERVGARLAAGG